MARRWPKRSLWLCQGARLRVHRSAGRHDSPPARSGAVTAVSRMSPCRWDRSPTLGRAPRAVPAVGGVRSRAATDDQSRPIRPTTPAHNTGATAEMKRRVARALDEADRRGDLFATTELRTASQ